MGRAGPADVGHLVGRSKAAGLSRQRPFIGIAAGGRCGQLPADSRPARPPPSPLGLQPPRAAPRARPLPAAAAGRGRRRQRVGLPFHQQRRVPVSGCWRWAGRVGGGGRGASRGGAAADSTSRGRRDPACLIPIGPRAGAGSPRSRGPTNRPSGARGGARVGTGPACGGRSLCRRRVGAAPHAPRRCAPPRRSRPSPLPRLPGRPRAPPNPKNPRELFDALDRCEGILSRQRYIAGDALTEADVRLYMCAARLAGGAAGLARRRPLF
jgi:hypothetical protein